MRADEVDARYLKAEILGGSMMGQGSDLVDCPRLGRSIKLGECLLYRIAGQTQFEYEPLTAITRGCPGCLSEDKSHPGQVCFYPDCRDRTEPGLIFCLRCAERYGRERTKRLAETVVYDIKPMGRRRLIRKKRYIEPILDVLYHFGIETSGLLELMMEITRTNGIRAKLLESIERDDGGGRTKGEANDRREAADDPASDDEAAGDQRAFNEFTGPGKSLFLGLTLTTRGFLVSHTKMRGQEEPQYSDDPDDDDEVRLYACEKRSLATLSERLRSAWAKIRDASLVWMVWERAFDDLIWLVKDPAELVGEKAVADLISVKRLWQLEETDRGWFGLLVLRPVHYDVIEQDYRRFVEEGERPMTTVLRGILATEKQVRLAVDERLVGLLGNRRFWPVVPPENCRHGVGLVGCGSCNAASLSEFELKALLNRELERSWRDEHELWQKALGLKGKTEKIAEIQRGTAGQFWSSVTFKKSRDAELVLSRFRKRGFVVQMSALRFLIPNFLVRIWEDGTEQQDAELVTTRARPRKRTKTRVKAAKPRAEVETKKPVKMSSAGIPRSMTDDEIRQAREKLLAMMAAKRARADKK